LTLAAGTLEILVQERNEKLRTKHLPTDVAFNRIYRYSIALEALDSLELFFGDTAFDN